MIAEVFQYAAPMTSKQNGYAAFYTPFHVCLLMAEATISDEPWLETTLEPCSGAGSMLVARWELVRRALLDAQKNGTVKAADVDDLVHGWVSGVTANDIDAEAVWATGVNLHVRTGVPGVVRHPYRPAVPNTTHG